MGVGVSGTYNSNQSYGVGVAGIGYGGQTVADYQSSTAPPTSGSTAPRTRLQSNYGPVSGFSTFFDGGQRRQQR